MLVGSQVPTGDQWRCDASAGQNIKRRSRSQLPVRCVADLRQAVHKKSIAKSFNAENSSAGARRPDPKLLQPSLRTAPHLMPETDRRPMTTWRNSFGTSRLAAALAVALALLAACGVRRRVAVVDGRVRWCAAIRPPGKPADPARAAGAGSFGGESAGRRAPTCCGVLAFCC